MISRLLVLALSFSPLIFSQSGVNFYSIAKEAELGRTVNDRFRAALTIVDEPQAARIASCPHH
jgi:hypothetical protein